MFSCAVTILGACLFLTQPVLQGSAAALDRGRGCLSGGCHPAAGGEVVAHPPYDRGECFACHLERSGEHPGSPGAEFPLKAQGADLCVPCHRSNDHERQMVHGPVASGACTYCHAPHGAANSGLLRLPLKEMCLDCHTDFAESLQEAAYVHSAIRDLHCGTCHNPHSSDRSSLLKEETTRLCFGCHTEIREKYDSSLDKHKALYVEKRCGNCHLVHYSSTPSLLVKEGMELCLDCHGRVDGDGLTGRTNIRREIEGKEMLHGPVAQGQCLGCHDPHGNGFSDLLTGSYPESFYAPYQSGGYDFCFQCHDEHLLGRETTEDGTGFRNGSRNLHFLHVAREQKGRTCRACHSVHATSGAKLINPDGIDFGDWKIPIRFTATDTGGSCAPGCHRPMKYDRQQAVDNSETAEPEGAVK